MDDYEIDEDYVPKEYSVKELCELTGLSKATVYRYIKKTNALATKEGRFCIYDETVLEGLKRDYVLKQIESSCSLEDILERVETLESWKSEASRVIKKLHQQVRDLRTTTS